MRPSRTVRRRACRRAARRRVVAPSHRVRLGAPRPPPRRAIIRAMNHVRAPATGCRACASSPRSPAPPTRTRRRCCARNAIVARRRSRARVRRYVAHARRRREPRLDGALQRRTRSCSMWLNSPPHRKVMLSRSFRRVGVGHSASSSRTLLRHRATSRTRRRSATRRRLIGAAGAALGSVAPCGARSSTPSRRRWVARWSASVYLLAQPATADMAAHSYRAWLFQHEGLTVWNAQWYGGHHVLGYSLLFAPLAAAIGPALVGVLVRGRRRRRCSSPLARAPRRRRRPRAPPRRGCSPPACSPTSRSGGCRSCSGSRSASAPGAAARGAAARRSRACSALGGDAGRARSRACS